MNKKQGKDIVITIGDPAGCGPEVTFRALKAIIDQPINFWVVGDRIVAEQIPAYHQIKDRLLFLDAATKNIEKIKRGSSSELSGAASLNYLQKALNLIGEKEIKRLVTGPVSKEAISMVKPGFSGHTEFLRDYFSLKRVAMMMFSAKIKTVLLTRHLNLDQIKKAITKDLVFETISLTYSFLRKQLRIEKPVIGLASVNPHAGVDTFMEKEEEVIKSAREQFGVAACGPYPADSLFTPDNLKKFNCIIAAYHDQGMIPFKLLSFYSGINISLGLPIIRTSPGHGVAYQLVKNNSQKIFHSSMEAAIIKALELN